MPNTARMFVLPSGSERTQGIECIFQVFFFFEGAVRVEDFSFPSSDRFFSCGDSLRENVFVGFQYGGSV
jgi:hypothetical protein